MSSNTISSFTIFQIATIFGVFCLAAGIWLTVITMTLVRETQKNLYVYGVDELTERMHNEAGYAAFALACWIMLGFSVMLASLAVESRINELKSAQPLPERAEGA